MTCTIVILAATGETAFIESIGLNMSLIDREPRVFAVSDNEGNKKEVRVGLSHATGQRVTAPSVTRGEDWTRRRIYREDATRLAEQRRFVQYSPEPGQEAAWHERALKDVRLLLNLYGENSAWLWDPFLGGEDLLKTLFHCTTAEPNCAR
jgi:hypothetical protein